MAVGKKRRIGMGALAAVMAGGLIWLAWPRLVPANLVYDGHRLGWWLRNVSPMPAGAQAAGVYPMDLLPHPDSRAVPYLVRALSRQEGWWGKVYTNLPAAIKNHIPAPCPAMFIRTRAAVLLGRVQPTAKQSIGALIQVAQKDNEIQVRLAAMDDGLAQVANGDEGAVAAMAEIARADTNTFVKMVATRTLGAIGSSNQLAIRTLIELATNSVNSDAWRRQEAISALGNLRSDDPRVSEAVSQLMKDPDQGVAEAAAEAESRIKKRAEGRREQ